MTLGRFFRLLLARQVDGSFVFYCFRIRSITVLLTPVIRDNCLIETPLLNAAKTALSPFFVVSRHIFLSFSFNIADYRNTILFSQDKRTVSASFSVSFANRSFSLQLTHVKNHFRKLILQLTTHSKACDKKMKNLK